LLVGPRGLAAQPVDRPVPGGRDDPAARTRRYAALRPLLHRRRERILYGVLGDLQIPEDPRQHRNRPAVLGAEDPGQIRCHDWKGLTSTDRLRRTLARRRAQWSAASRSSTWMTVKPPRCSLPSVNGPSVIRTSSPCAFSTVAVSGGCRPAANTQTPA